MDCKVQSACDVGYYKKFFIINFCYYKLLKSKFQSFEKNCNPESPRRFFIVEI